ncbi:hypothetical protein [Paradevosia shaoguanensis]|uniref:Uncharacterized protein n=1 Tax=Paradevosia shaoguanensis TaxID=1335043 RepID=A0AA41QJ82_9HYPH|nr:hypothetical protein [Paradevosia shaoguanensis]MCF1741457.1 hypothetical protein [Paradevosia shaoguanensis]MCI0125940.1 hypothetical protein [Paradevosia shaoguanensis]
MFILRSWKPPDRLRPRKRRSDMRGSDAFLSWSFLFGSEMVVLRSERHRFRSELAFNNFNRLFVFSGERKYDYLMQSPLVLVLAWQFHIIRSTLSWRLKAYCARRALD